MTEIQHKQAYSHYFFQKKQPTINAIFINGELLTIF